MTRRSPLNDEHERLGARLIEFGGWRMPLSYSGIIEEHKAVRERMGLFDVSHLGKLWVEGPESEAGLDGLLPGKVRSLKTWRAGYNLLLNEEGGIVDDLFLYRYPSGFLVVPNAANTDSVMTILREKLGDATVADARPEWAILALSGPKVRDILTGELAECSGLRLHEFAEIAVGETKVMVARTGYTGELTYEFFVPSEDAMPVWRRLLEAGDPYGIMPTGLGARDTLRLEMGYPLHGNDISEATTPLESGLEWVVDWSKDFPPKPALERAKARGLEKRLIGLVGRGGQIPRKGYVVGQGDREIGRVTSGNFSPTLGKGIALAYVAADVAVPGNEVWVDIRGKRLEADLVKPPFIKR
ncbi:MAG TPA: glycine cleavage system aminomethyltransferase GcvT [Actinomycetota bacterium]|nr:glycine cleavage system aminomethyltransferase GcvT [Actinomycetota bacterium]